MLTLRLHPLKPDFCCRQYCINVNVTTTLPAGDIRISNQFLITRALHFAQLRQAYYQASVTITLGHRI